MNHVSEYSIPGLGEEGLREHQRQPVDEGGGVGRAEETGTRTGDGARQSQIQDCITI